MLDRFFVPEGHLRVGSYWNGADDGKKPIVMLGRHRVITLLPLRYNDQLQHRDRHVAESPFKQVHFDCGTNFVRVYGELGITARNGNRLEAGKFLSGQQLHVGFRPTGGFKHGWSMGTHD